MRLSICLLIGLVMVSCSSVLAGIINPPASLPVIGLSSVYSVTNGYAGTRCYHNRTVSTCSMTASSTTITYTGGGSPGWFAGEIVQVQGGGQPFNNRGAWTASTTYNLGDEVSYKGQELTPFRGSNTDTYFTLTSWLSIVDSATSLDLDATIVSVSGSTAVLSNPALTTVTNANFSYGGDDSAAFEAARDAAYNAGGGDVYVPKGNYFVSGVLVYSHVHFIMAPGVSITPALNNSTAAQSFKTPFYFRGASTTVSKDCSITGNNWQVDCTGIQPEYYDGSAWYWRGLGGVAVDLASDWKISGLTTQNLTGGNAVQVSPGTGNVNPVRGIIENINDINDGLGWGAVQLDGGDSISVSNISCDEGRTVNCETDDNSTDLRVLSNIEIRNVTLNARNSSICQEAIGMAAHSNQIYNIHCYNISATGGGGGATISNTAISPGATPVNGTNGGTVDHWLIDGMHVSGGGEGVRLGTNYYCLDGVVENSFFEGTTAINLSNNIPYPVTVTTSGVTYKNCKILNGLSDGLATAYFDGTTCKMAPGTSTIENCTIGSCGSIGILAYGINNTSCLHLRIIGCDIKDGVSSNILAPSLLDCQTTTSAVGNWTYSGSGSSAQVRSTNSNWRASLVNTALNTAPTSVLAESTRSTSPTTEVTPVIPGVWYKMVGAVKPLGAAAEADTSGAHDNFTLGAFLADNSGSSTGSVVSVSGLYTPKVGQWTNIESVIYIPTGSYYAAMNLAVNDVSGMTSGSQYEFIPVSFGPLVYQPAAAQTFTATGGTTTTITSASSPLFKNAVLYCVSGANAGVSNKVDSGSGITGSGPYTITVHTAYSNAVTNGDVFVIGTRMAAGLNQAQGTSAEIINCSLGPNANATANRVIGSGTYTEIDSRDPDGLNWFQSPAISVAAISGPPTIATSTNSSAATITGTDDSGTITLTANTSSTGNLCVVTFATAKALAPKVFVQNTSAVSVTNPDLRVTSTTTGFTVANGGATVSGNTITLSYADSRIP